MKFIALTLVLLAGCTQLPTKCVEAHSPGVTIKSTDPRIADVTITPTVTNVCVTPAYVVNQ